MVAMPDCGGAWVPDTGGGGEGALPAGNLEQLNKFGVKGIVISGVVTWIEAQLGTLGTDIWKSLAERCFQENEVTEAKEALRNAKGPLLETLVSDFKKNRSGVNKKAAEIDDIKRAILALQQAGEMPLVLATSTQMAKCPQSWGVSQSPTSQDVMGKIALLEKALADTTEIQKENMRHIRDEIAATRAGPPKTPGIPTFSFNPDTPGTKKRKLDQAQQANNQEQQQSYAAMAGIQPISSQEQQGMMILQNLLQQNQQSKANSVPKQKKNICYGSAKSNSEGLQESKLSADVSFVASGVAKDCTAEMLKEFLAERGINAVEVEQLTKAEVVPQVRTLTFRVAVKAADYESALNPEVWPFRVGVRHYRQPRRSDRADDGWRGQSGRSGGHVNADGGAQPRGQAGGQAGGNVGGQASGQHLPPGHPGRVRHHQQQMGPRQLGPVEMTNFWNALNSLGNVMGPPNQ